MINTGRNMKQAISKVLFLSFFLFIECITICAMGPNSDNKSEKKSYPCPKCNKSFTRSTDVKRHLLTHDKKKPCLKKPSKEKSYSCTICDKNFTTKQSLKWHIRIHTGEKPYRCSLCNKPFRQQSHYTRHIKQHHTDQQQPLFAIQSAAAMQILYNVQKTQEPQSEIILPSDGTQQPMVQNTHNNNVLAQLTVVNNNNNFYQQAPHNIQNTSNKKRRRPSGQDFSDRQLKQQKNNPVDSIQVMQQVPVITTSHVTSNPVVPVVSGEEDFWGELLLNNNPFEKGDDFFC